MNDQTDSQLLRAYAEHRSEPAFAELVRRHVDFVYSAALRMVCDSHCAQDVTQGVFVALAKNAIQLTDRPVLSGWLHRTAQNIAAQTVRTDVRRRVREQEAAAMNELLSTESDASWELIAPQLDAALGELSEPDRDALLLRYFERRSAHEMALTLGVSDEAAQRRVSRAVERLREFFTKRGVTIGTGGLVVVISANAVQAAPVGLAVTISTAAALSGAAIQTSTIIAATKTIAMTTLQKTLVTATVAVLAGAGIYQARQASQLRDKNKALQQQQAPLVEQIQQLQKDREESVRQLAALRDDNERLKRNPSELLRLRGEVARLRTDSQELTRLKSSGPESKPAPEDEAWIRRISLLKQKVQQTPQAKIPELQFLTEQDWMEAARHKLETDEDYQRAFSDVCSRAQSHFLDKARPALQKYLAANGNQFPAEVLQLKEFFEEPPGDEVLQRYQVVSASSKPLASPSEKTEGWIITPKFSREGEFTALGRDGGVSHTVDSPEMRILAPAIQAMLEATPVINGRRSTDIHQLGPYLTTPEQKAAYERLMGNRK